MKTNIHEYPTLVNQVEIFKLEGAQLPIEKSAFEKRVRGVGGMLPLKILEI